MSAGQRVAINLSNVKKDMINRGDIICVKDSILLTKSIDEKLKLFDTTNRKIKNNDRVHINFGSRQTECKIVLLDCDEMSSKESGYAQLKFDKEIAIKKDDLFILRFLSPVESMAGGKVLDEFKKITHSIPMLSLSNVFMTLFLLLIKFFLSLLNMFIISSLLEL